MTPPPASIGQRVTEGLSRHPALAGASALALALAPTLTLPFAGRDFYHLERAHAWSWRTFWLADTFRYDEYFWWPHDGYWCRFFRPVGSAVTAGIQHLAGDTPLAFRVVGLTLMLACVALFAALCARARLRSGAIVGATLWFALHPSRAVLAVEPVATAIVDGLLLATMLTALLGFASWRDGWRHGRLLTWAAVVTALGTKELAVIVPLALVAWDALIPPTTRSWRALARRHGAWLALTVLYLPLWSALVARGNQLRPPYYVTASSAQPLAQWAQRFVLHLSHVMVPAPFHPIADPEYYARHPVLLVALAGGALALYVACAKIAWRSGLARFALALVLLGLAPVIPVLPQLQEQFVPSVGAALLLGAALDALGARARVIGRAVVIAQAAALAASLVVMTAACRETAAAYAALRRAAPTVSPGAHLYFVNSGPATFMYASSAVRLLYGDPTLHVSHLSFDTHDLPDRPTSAAGRIVVAALAAASGASVGVSQPTLQRLGPRQLLLRSDDKSFFASDLGRFLLMGRPPLPRGEELRWDDFVARIEDADGEGVRQLRFTFDGPLDDQHRLFFFWRGVDVASVPMALPRLSAEEAQR